LIAIVIISAGLSWKSYFTISLIVVCDKGLLRDGTASPVANGEFIAARTVIWAAGNTDNWYAVGLQEFVNYELVKSDTGF